MLRLVESYTVRYTTLRRIDLQVGSDTIFFGLGNLGLKIVAMSYEMSLCFGNTQQNQLRTYGGETARANTRSPIKRNIGRFFGQPDRAIQRTGYRITLTPHKLPPRRSCVQSLFVCKPMSKVARTPLQVPQIGAPPTALPTLNHQK